MNLRLVEALDHKVSDIPQETLNVLEYYSTIESILDQTYSALGEKRTVFTSNSVASSNAKIDVRCSSVTKAENFTGLA